MKTVARLLNLAALAAAIAPAHDMWIEPSSFFPQTGQIMTVRLKVGENLVGDPIPRNPQLVNQFLVEDATGRKPLPGRPGADPAGMLRIASTGVHVIGYFSNPSQVELEGDKFTEYLKQEGLDHVIAARVRGNQSGASVRELFSRCAKSIVRSGDEATAAAQVDRTLGFPLELLAETNPFKLTTGSALALRLTYQNKPLAGTLVVAMNRMNPAQKVTARSDRAGRVRLTLPHTGMWMIKAVHMVPAANPAEADWASYWASLTFEIPAAAQAAAAKQ